MKLLGLAEEDALEQDALGFGEGTWAEQACRSSWIGVWRKEFPSKEEREDPKEREDMMKRRK